MKFLLIFFSLCFVAVSCSEGFKNLARFYYPNTNRTPKVYEEIAEAILNYKISDEDGMNSPIFESLLKTVSQLEGISTKTEYKSLNAGLDEHLKSCTLHVILKAKAKTLTVEEAEFFFKKLFFVAKEANPRRANIVEELELSSRTLELIFSAIKEIGNRFLNMKSPPWTIQNIYSEIHLFIACFVIFCKTDADLKEPLDQILRIIERENKVFPIFTFNRHLEQAYEFSHFLRQCYILYRSHGRYNLSIAKTLIYGPISPVSYEILHSMGLNKVLETFSNTEIDRNRLIYHIIGNNSRDMFLQYFEAHPTSVTEQLKKDIERQISNLDAITAFISYNFDDGIESNAEILALFDEKVDALREFHHIDKNFVGRCVMGLDKIISRLIDALNAQENEINFNALLILIMKYYSVLPDIDLDNFKSNTIERVLDLMVHPWADTRMLVNTYGFTIRGVLELAYIKITASLLTKLNNVFSLVHGEQGAIKVTDSLAIFILFTNNRKDTFEVFKEIHKYHESKQLCTVLLAQIAIMRAVNAFNNDLAKQLINYAVAHGLLSKSYKLISAKLLVKFEDPDYQSQSTSNSQNDDI